MKSLIVIPARFGSSRFPGKPLVQIAGKSMIERVYRQCCLTSADHVLIATDDARIMDHCRTFTDSVLLTSDQHLNGTSRCAEALEVLSAQGKHFDVLLNVQGDEPFIDPDLIQSMLLAFKSSQAHILTVAVPVHSSEEVQQPNVVKVVMGKHNGFAAPALYFSRSVIPYPRSSDVYPSYYRHIGLYAFRTRDLPAIVHLPPSELELTEHLEQLRWLENDFRIDVVLNNDLPAPAVDSPEDLITVENFLKKHPEFI